MTLHESIARRSIEVDRLLAAIPASLRDLSGTALYSGLSSWTRPSPLYVMGINPGSAPGPDTVYGNAVNLLTNEDANYSSYRDEQWPDGRGHLYGRAQHPMQLSILHLFDRLGLDPGLVPSSNMIYARSRRADDIASDDMRDWAEECWPFHAEMIEQLGVRVVLCMGAAPANFVRRKVGSHKMTEEFVPTQGNSPRVSRVYTGGSVTVVHAAHPSYGQYWYHPSRDIAPLVAQALNASTNTAPPSPATLAISTDAPSMQAGRDAAIRPAEQSARERVNYLSTATAVPVDGDGKPLEAIPGEPTGSTVRVGDVLVSHASAAKRKGSVTFTVAKVRRGPKWVTLYDADGVQHRRIK